MRIGLTGGIACGKSTVSAMLTELGAHVVDADRVAREVVLPGEPALQAIVEKFGQAVLSEDGTLNRPALGSIVFGQADRLRELEAITHPAIRKRMRAQMEQAESLEADPIVVADIPLLYETEQQSSYEGVIVVYVPHEVQRDRLMKRNSLAVEEAERRIGLQMDIERKRSMANWVIDNSGTLEETRKQVEQLWNSLRRK
ncbi:dephospho-CoA kinase [Paenibacillus cellulosilyticus]|uniref:Dephospho-CoA kinase n=1 Tax=Paenibacillus cellulosilyticus TaxID=375489 RepID=A0A2V2YRB1_9BACL|nr:dephospho-CoA kinase [Paenibacillus cellulosilyticus]PWV99450.1 dephospho-CoA kinase [Paenibacillus cellulosilyticus]QKS44708.1 dephospho-CoA kinase [Paenibacillus cellulosilyticus]